MSQDVVRHCTSRLIVSQAGGLKCPSSVTGDNLASSSLVKSPEPITRRNRGLPAKKVAKILCVTPSHHALRGTAHFEHTLEIAYTLHVNLPHLNVDYLGSR